MSDKRPAYCWDSCVIIGLLKEETDKPLEAMKAIAGDVERDKADLIISVMTLLEFEDIVDDMFLREQFSRFLERDNVMLVDLNPPVATRAAILRRRARQLTPPRSIKAADASVIATAMLYGADVLHTTDDKLLNISGTEVVDNLRIIRPQLLSGQQLLPYSTSDAPIRRKPPFHHNGAHPQFGRQPNALELACMPRSLSTVR